MSDELRKAMEGSGRGLILWYCPVIYLEELSKTTINLSQDCRSPDEVLDTEPPEYEAKLFTTNLPILTCFICSQ
jgi:hypothetical protein